MELVLALAIGVLVASGVWLILRPRTFQVIIGLTLISYGVNLFASVKTPDETIYKIVKAMHEHAGEFGNIFPPMKLFDKNEMAQEVAGTEYHPGAVKYYKEIGQWPPKKQ